MNNSLLEILFKNLLIMFLNMTSINLYLLREGVEVPLEVKNALEVSISRRQTH